MIKEHDETKVVSHFESFYMELAENNEKNPSKL